MEYYQTEALAPVERKWQSCRAIVKSGEQFLFVPSEMLTLDQAEVEVVRLKNHYKNIEFRIMPFDDVKTNG